MPQNCGAVAGDEPIMNKSSLCPKLATVLPPTRLTVARRKANRGTAVSNRCAGNGGNGAAGNFAFAVAGIDGALNFISYQCDAQLSSVSASKKFPKCVNRHEFYPCDTGQTKAFTYLFGDSTRTVCAALEGQDEGTWRIAFIVCLPISILWRVWQN